MPDQETVVQQTATDDATIADVPANAPTQQTATAAADTLVAYEPAAQDPQEWSEEPVEELPPRPRRRLLAPVPLALLGVLLIACGFIVGVLVEKGQTSSNSAGASGAAGLASRFAALRGAAGGGTSGTSAGGASAAGGFIGRSSSGAAGATVGQVAYISGHTLYVTNSEGNTVKVTTSAASTITKTVKADVKGIHPGETVVVTGAAGANGAISAESIRVGGSGGLGGLFAGSGGSGRSSKGSGEPALFGSGG